MKKLLTAKELITYLDKKTAQLEGALMIHQSFPIDPSTINKREAFYNGIEIGKLKGQRDVLVELALMLKL